MTRQEATAIAKAMWRYLDKVGGYQPYGWDWPTLRVLYPRIAAQLKACYRILADANKEIA
jgi:hypothetical protein